MRGDGEASPPIIMIRWIKKLFKLALLLVVVALIFNFQYRGKSARQYALEYGLPAVEWVYEKIKWLINKDVTEIVPKSVPDLKEKAKEVQKEIYSVMPNGKGETQVQNKGLAESKPRQDSITNQDREKLKQLLERKIK